MVTHSITKRLPKWFKYQSNDRIFNIIPSNCLEFHSYTCFKQIREEKTEYVYFDATNCSINIELPIFAVKSSIFQEIPTKSEQGTCNKI